jgi:hypothetical protein
MNRRRVLRNYLLAGVMTTLGLVIPTSSQAFDEYCAEWCFEQCSFFCYMQNRTCEVATGCWTGSNCSCEGYCA